MVVVANGKVQIFSAFSRRFAVYFRKMWQQRRDDAQEINRNVITETRTTNTEIRVEKKVGYEHKPGTNQLLNNLILAIHYLLNYLNDETTTRPTLLLCGDRQETGWYPATDVLLALPLATDEAVVLTGNDVTFVVDGFVSVSGRETEAPPLPDCDVRAFRASVLLFRRLSR